MAEPELTDKATFHLIALVAQHDGVQGIVARPGCWERDLPDGWRISVNGHADPTDNSDGVPVPPFTVYVQYNGWPAGFIDPMGGVLAAGEAANEAAFRAALQKAIDEPKAGDGGADAAGGPQGHG